MWIHRPYLMLCIVSDVGISVVLLCNCFFPSSSMYLLCSLIAQLLVDRTISYPPELGNTMVSLCSETLRFKPEGEKSTICPQCESSLRSSEAGSPDWSQGSFRSGPETRIQTKPRRRAFQNPLVPSFERLQGMKDVSID